MDQKAHPRLTVFGLLFDKLVVRWSAAKAPRQEVFQHANDVRIKERHPPGGQLLETSNRLQMRRPTQVLEPATAGALEDLGAVAQRNIQEDEPGRGPKR